MNKPRYKTYNVDEIKGIELKRSSKGFVSYWVRIRTKFIRIGKNYFFILKEQGIKVFLLNDYAKSCLVKKVRCSGITKVAGLQCTRLRWGFSSYCWQHDAKRPNYMKKSFKEMIRKNKKRIPWWLL